ncbi:MAG: aquaporin [Bacteroidota bacterium]|nr:aquaporin [Bacteroidota bacterium]
MKKLLAEFIGSFFLVICITLCVLGKAGAMAGIGIGAVLIAMVYAGGHISGAHFNPAVTIAVFLRGKCALADVPGYIIAQLLGAALAAVVGSNFLLGVSGQGMEMTTNVAQCLVAEFLGTFALCYVVLNVATSKDTAGNSFYGLAIGLTVMAGVYAFGPISGAAFNPAVALSFAITNISGLSNLWIYIIAEILAAVLAAYTFLFINGSE